MGEIFIIVLIVMRYHFGDVLPWWTWALAVLNMLALSNLQVYLKEG